MNEKIKSVICQLTVSITTDFMEHLKQKKTNQRIKGLLDDDIIINTYSKDLYQMCFQIGFQKQFSADDLTAVNNPKGFKPFAC